jgi:hypothetical protein
MKQKHLAKLLGAFMAAIMIVAVVAPMASAEKPKPPYEQFAGCPNKVENIKIKSCIHSVVKGGHFQMGNKDVPITKPIALTGGVGRNFANFSFNSEGGLSEAKQTFPGGVVGLTGLNWLLELLSVEQLKLYAVTQLAGTVVIKDTEHLTLPIKVHLINPVLGNNCYVGSNSNPITLNLTTGTTEPPPPNKPITGKEPELFFDPPTEIYSSLNGEFVDNSFAAPGASGCVLNLGLIPLNIDGLINVASGLPSPAGTNETRQVTDTELVESALVYP